MSVSGVMIGGQLGELVHQSLRINPEGYRVSEKDQTGVKKEKEFRRKKVPQTFRGLVPGSGAGNADPKGTIQDILGSARAWVFETGIFVKAGREEDHQEGTRGPGVPFFTASAKTNQGGESTDAGFGKEKKKGGPGRLWLWGGFCSRGGAGRDWGSKRNPV